MPKNLYFVLGVPQGETAAGIRTAYHELARRIHPDVAGPSGAKRYQEISEAYEVLSDPARRRAHDREFAGPERGEEVPVRGGAPGWEMAPEPISLFGQPEQTRPAFDAFRERYFRNFTGWHVPKGERAESLTLGVALSPAEAFCGCTVPVGVPVFGVCRACGGSGRVFPFRCTECGGAGRVETERALWVSVAPRVTPGTVMEMALERFGIGNLYLRVQVAISDAL